MAFSSTGQAPYGFRWAGRRLVSNGEEATIRRTIFELFGEHRRKGTVARILNERGLRTRRSSKWSDVAVSRQLTCTSAKGVYAINKTTTNEAGKRIERPEEEWEFVECDRIVSDELWDRVQAILKEQKATGPPSGKKPVHTFSGILRCSCGGKLTVPSNSLKYVCGKCRNKIPFEDLEDIFRDQLSRLIHDRPDLFGEPPAADENLAESETRLAEAREEIRKTKREMKHFEQLFAGGEISLERFGEVHAPLEEKRKSLTEKTRRVESTIRLKKSASPSNDKAKPETVDSDFRILVDQWHSVPQGDRRAIVQSLVSQITLGDSQVEFKYQFPDKSEVPSKDAAESQQMASPTNGLAPDPDEPYYIRLPRSKERCPRTGMSRTKLNELILPSPRNNHKPPVESICPKLPGRTRGTRLIVWPSLKRYLAELNSET